MYQNKFCPSYVIALLILTMATPSIAVDQAEDMQVGPRALSRAFRTAARDASPSVVTILSFGQNVQEDSEDDSADNDDSTADAPSDRDRQRDEQLPGREQIPGGNAADGENERDTDSADEGPDAPGPVPSPRRSDDGTTLAVTGLGSGVIISSDGRIITNNHVIAGAKKVVVQLADQTEFEAYEIHGDQDSDVASLRVKPTESLVAATLGNSDTLEIGDWVLAIGSPFKLETTVSAGIISAKHRAIMRISRGRLLQTDAAINPGNSGGPLIDLNGDVVAINTAIATRNGGYQGIGFAIPINQAKWIADELAQHGRVRRAAIGVQLAELNKKIAAKLELPVGSGVAVYQVIEGSAAAKAGLKPLDVIVEFAGEPVRRAADLQEIIERLPIGSTQGVKVKRAGESVEVQVHLAPLEDPTDVPKDAEPPKP